MGRKQLLELPWGTKLDAATVDAGLGFLAAVGELKTTGHKSCPWYAVA